MQSKDLQVRRCQGNHHQWLVLDRIVLRLQHHRFCVQSTSVHIIIEDSPCLHPVLMTNNVPTVYAVLKPVTKISI
jgi:hypothetical protein